MSTHAIDIVIQLAVILFAISGHESCHAWMALRFGDPTARDQGRISLNPLHHIDPFGTVLLPIMCVILHAPVFGYAKPTPVNLGNTRNPRLANFWVSAAGPLSNLVMASVGIVAFGIAGRISPAAAVGVRSGQMEAGVLAPLVYVLFWFVLINVILGIFNLIPVPPMDGSGILFSLLGRRGLRLELFFHRYAFVMFIVILMLLRTRVFGMILNPFLQLAGYLMESAAGLR